MVYEFDAADVAGSYMYPAMARTFRGAGFQWATQFAYDPLALAYANTEYQTHLLNLVYTPAKAISFMIAGAAFHEIPRGATFGRYPDSERFGSFRVSYTEDLSEMVSDTAFYYSNTTSTVPPSPRALRHVAGVGSSPVVAYDGTGTYFIDRLADGVWRLEAYPDVAWVVDPFTQPSLDREAARVIWRLRSMRVALPGLGTDFSVQPVNSGNEHRPAVRDGRFDVRPGAYLLTRAGVTHTWAPGTVIDGRSLDAFVAPPSTKAPTVVVHAPPAEIVADRPHTIHVEVVSAAPPDSVVVFGRRVGAWGRPLRIVMEPWGAFGYRVTVPAEQVRDGLLEYSVAVFAEDEARTFPGGVAGHPFRWDFTGREAWRVPVVAEPAAILLFDARRDLDHVLYPHPWEYVRFRTDLLAGSEPERLALTAVVESFGPSPHHFALRTFLPEGQRTRLGETPADAVLRIRARSAGRASDRVEIALVERDGTAWGTVVELTDAWQDLTIPLSALRPTPLALLPRPYPQFLPYLLEPATTSDAPRIGVLDGIQFSTSAALFATGGGEGEHGFQIERVVLERDPERP
jgi:hypothetical protein